MSTEPRTAAGRTVLAGLHPHGGLPVCGRCGEVLTPIIEAEAAEPALDADLLAEAAYTDRPPTGPRPVPWPPRLRKDWQAWARRIVVRLAAGEPADEPDLSEGWGSDR